MKKKTFLEIAFRIGKNTGNALLNTFQQWTDNLWLECYFVIFLIPYIIASWQPPLWINLGADQSDHTSGAGKPRPTATSPPVRHQQRVGKHSGKG